LTQRAHDRLAVSGDLIDQSHLLIGEAHQAQARTHAIGLAYADWRLRLDLLEQERALTESVDGR
jgi:hypothetical protein